MSFDYEDWLAAKKEKQDRRHAEQISGMAQLMQAEIPMSALMGSTEWDMYLQMLQGAIEVTKKQRAAFAEALADPSMTGDEEVRRIRIQMLLCDERIRAWETAVALPKQVRDDSKKAAEILAKATSKSEIAA